MHILAKLRVKYDFCTSTAVDGAEELFTLFERVNYTLDVNDFFFIFLI